MEAYECVCCLMELDNEQLTYYNHSHDPDTWIRCVFCWETISELLSTKFHQYMKDVYNSKCKKTLNGMMESGPPVWFSDKALPVPEGAHVFQFRNNGREIDAIYDGAVRGNERQQLWDHVKEAIQQRISLMTTTEEEGDADF